MFVSSRRIFNNLVPSFVKNIKTLKTKPVLNYFKRSDVKRRLFIACGFMMALGYVHAIEDESIRNIKSIMNRQINQLRS